MHQICAKLLDWSFQLISTPSKGLHKKISNLIISVDYKLGPPLDISVKSVTTGHYDTMNRLHIFDVENIKGIMSKLSVKVFL